MFPGSPIGNSGRETDVIPMKGLAFPRNKSGGKAEFALVRRQSSECRPLHFGQGQATPDTLGQMINLTKVTGTVVYRTTGTYAIDKFGTPSVPVECFGSGTLGTGMKLAGHQSILLTATHARSF